MDLCPDDIEDVSVPEVKPTAGQKKTVKDALKALVVKPNGKTRMVASSDAWAECQRVAPTFPLAEFEVVCRELQDAWDAKRAAKAIEDGKVTP
jgi:hypothetical protein